MMTPRGTTRGGQPTQLPEAGYEAPSITSAATAGSFRGEDGRELKFDISTLALPGWHAALAEAWAVRVSATGTLRTKASVNHAWGNLNRMMNTFDAMLRPPQSPEDLTAEHVASYLRLRSANRNASSVREEARTNAMLFDLEPLRSLVSAEARDLMRPRGPNRRKPVPGYSDGELRRLIIAARKDVAAIRNRLTVGMTETLAEPDRTRLERARATGRVPLDGVPLTARYRVSKRIAERCFVTLADLTPMLVLLVASTGWNVEVIKELPLEFRNIEDHAIELSVVKRRRGPGHWHNRVTWELGPLNKRLSTPGGLYQLCRELMAPARTLCGEDSFWAIWQPSGRREQGCRNPFQNELNANLHPDRWISKHGLKADPRSPDADSEPLKLNFNRLKTSIDVRRTRQVGGHLASAVRSNTPQVLFQHYLSGDPVAVEWSREILTDTLGEVERRAWDAHRRELARDGRQALDVRVAAGSESSDSVTDVAWTACGDIEHHPRTGARCAASFLDCFNCKNCVVTNSHLPRLLDLVDALEERRRIMSDEHWWEKYGTAWTAIRHDVLPHFSEAEVSHAAAMKAGDSLLDLVEPGWEAP